MPSIQETLEYFRIDLLDICNCTSVVELLFEFKRINIIKIEWLHSLNYEELENLKQEIGQFEKKLRKKHSEIDIKIDYVEKSY